MMNPYVNWLLDVSKLVYLVGNYEQTAKLKKLLDSNDPKNRIFFRCVENFPANALVKQKLEGAREGILRADWLQKTLQRYPQMVVFLFDCGEETEMEAIENILKDMLKKMNLFVIDTLRQNKKEEVVVRFVVTLTKTQFSNQQILEKVNYYLNTYNKDSFVINYDNLGKEIAKYRYTWLNYLQKNYQKKMRKLQRKLEESISQDKRICYAFKVSIFSQILGKNERQRYDELYKWLKMKFSDLTSKEFTFLKYLEIREVRIIADLTVLRSIKGKIISNSKDIPPFLQDHINFFKMRNLDPTTCHFYYYFQELNWRAAFLEQALEILGATDLVQLLPHNVVAQWLNGLLSYLHRLSTIDAAVLQGLGGEILPLTGNNYLGRYDYGDVTDADIVMTETSQLLARKKDLIVKGIQIITRYKVLGLFKDNQVNFLNIYLIRFHIAEGKFSAITEIYNQILKVEANRCNYFLINQLFKDVQEEMHKVNPQSKRFIYGVASLICDYFENDEELNKYLKLFLQLQPKATEEDLIQTSPKKASLFDSPETDHHIFKLKKKSKIFSMRVLISQQIILGNDKYLLHLKIYIGDLLRKQFKAGKQLIRIKFNHAKMIHEFPLELKEGEGDWIERDVDIEPLYYIHRDAMFHIEEVQLVMNQQNLAWVLERNQLAFDRYNSTLFHSKIRQPDIQLLNVKKIYYLNETFAFDVVVKKVEDCMVTAKLSVVEEDQSKTQFFMSKDDKTDLINSKRNEQLVVGADQVNTCWVKCNKLGLKAIKLQFTLQVEKSIEVGWRDKPLNIKSSYNVTRQLRFNVLSPFTITKTFREAISGAYSQSKVPLHKKMLLCFNVKSNDNIDITEITHHNNPRKVKYFKNFKLANIHLSPGDSIKLNLLFELGDDCTDEFDLFLTTLFIKWRRKESPVDNITLDENTIVQPSTGLVEVSYHQREDLVRKTKGGLLVRVRNLCSDPNNIKVTVDSSQEVMRVGQKAKWKILNGHQSHDFDFSVLCLKGGIFALPNIRVYVNNSETAINTTNFLLHCQ